MDVDQEQNVNSECPEARSEAPTNSSSMIPSDSTIPSLATDPEEDLEIEDSESVPKLRSPAWQHFERFKDKSGEWKARCKACKKVLGGDTKNGTHHLHVHMKRCKRKGTVDIRQALLVHNFTKGKDMRTGIFEQEKGRKALCNMIIMHEYPLAMVEHRGFLRYSSSLQPLFRVPTRNTVKADALKVYESEKLKTMELLDQNEGRIAITTDMWTSKQKKGYMAITAHFIDNSWTLRSRLLRFAYVPCPHTSEALSQALVECLLDWNIDSKLSTMTLDNCSTNDAMVDILLDKLSVDKLVLSGKLFHMRCCAHILNLIVKDGLEVIKGAIEKIRESVLYWTAATAREEKFEETAKQLRIPCKKKLSYDVATRWNSTYLMLETAIIYKDVFHRLKQREKKYKTLPTESEWEIAREVCNRLKIFFNVTELFSGTKYHTANLYFPQVCEVKLSLMEWLQSPIEVIRRMAAPMLEKFNKYWDVVHGLMGVASVLDTRYKLVFIGFMFEQIYGNEEYVFEVEKIRKLCADLVVEYERKIGASGNNDDNFSANSAGGGNRFEKFDMLVMNMNRTRTSAGRTELDNYLEEPPVLRNTPNFDILVWWKINGHKYPILQAIARDLLAIPISTVASESTFSTGGRVVSPHRNKLHPKMVEILMCAQNWVLANQKNDEDTSGKNDFAKLGEDFSLKNGEDSPPPSLDANEGVQE